MLYDILSPLVFFLSLGGILLIVGRVVIRVRRQQFSTNIQAAALPSSEPTTSFSTQVPSQVSALLQPSQKSVHVIKSRVGLFATNLRESSAAVRSSVRSWRAARATPATPVSETTSGTPDLTPVQPTETGTVIAPIPRTSLGSKLKGVGRKARSRGRQALGVVRKRIQAEQAAEEVILSAEVAAQTPVVTSTPRLRLTRQVKKEGAGSEQPTIHLAESTTSVGESTTTADEQVVGRGMMGGMLRRARTKKVIASSLEKALAELQAAHYQQAEDMLVPYIVKHPKDTTAYMLLGRAALGREAWPEAVEIFEQVVAWNPQEEGAYADLGAAAYKAGKFTRALQALQRAHEADPTDRIILEQLMDIAQKMDNPALQHSIEEKITALAAVEVVETSEAQHVAAK